MEDQLSTTQRTSEYVVAYGYNQKFYLTEEQAKALVDATQEGKKIVRFKDKILSTNYSWIVPLDQVEKVDLTSKELAVAEKIAEWIARPANEIGMTYQSALIYSKNIVSKKGISHATKLFDKYANGAYPSVKSFMLNAKNEEL